MLIYFSANKLISKAQSGFQPGDSCINHLLSITHEIFTPFDNGLEVRSAFLDISKAFDKAWYEGLVSKLKHNTIFGELFHILFDFLSNRKQRVVLNGQNSSWANVHAGVPQGSILGPLIFLIYISDLSDNLTSNAKLFADDTSLFSVVHDVNTSAKELNDDLKKVNDWAFQWKVSFNPDRSKQAEEVIFSWISKRSTHPPLVFNNNNVSQTYSQKHLGVILDFKLTFEEHLNNVLAKVNKAVGLLRKLRNILPRTTLVTIYKAFIRPHLDYGDVLYDQAFNNSFKEKLESVQYNVFLALTGAISGASKEKICQELELESLRDRRCCKKLCLFYKVLKNKNPKFLFSLIPTRRLLYSTQNIHNIHLLNTKHNFFKDSVIYN